jgi:hypothetical protein
VDFVWSWARDVYLPKIVQCIRHAVPALREISPSTVFSFSRSQSILSDSEPHLFSENPLGITRDEDVERDEVESHYYRNFTEAPSHLIRGLPYRHQSSIRQSDIVLFSFQLVEIPRTEGIFTVFGYLREENPEMDFLQILQDGLHPLLLRRSQLMQIEEHWVGCARSSSFLSNLAKPNDLVQAFIFFRTYCRREDWQIVRGLYCIIQSFDPSEISGTGLTEAYIQLDLSLATNGFHIKTFGGLRGLYGKDSVSFALHSLQFVLTFERDERETRWRFPDVDWIPDAAVEQLSLIISSASSRLPPGVQHHQNDRLVQVSRDADARLNAGLPDISEDIGTYGVMPAMKPDFWRSECSRFCLFVLLDRGFDDEKLLGQLLRTCIRSGEMYGVSSGTSDEGPKMTSSDKIELNDWVKSFRTE